MSGSCNIWQRFFHDHSLSFLAKISELCTFGLIIVDIKIERGSQGLIKYVQRIDIDVVMLVAPTALTLT